MRRNTLQTMIGAVAVVISASSVSAPAQATLIDHGLTTEDDATGLEWLDLTQTVGQSYNSVLAGYGGYTTSGWSPAAGAQICLLFSTYGAAFPACDTPPFQVVPVADATALALVGLFGDTFSGAEVAASGMYKSSFDAAGWVSEACIDTTLAGCFFAGTANLGTYNNWNLDTSGLDYSGTWLVRPYQASVVPEPSTLALFGAGLSGASPHSAAAARRRRKQNSHHRFRCAVFGPPLFVCAAVSIARNVQRWLMNGHIGRSS